MPGKRSDHIEAAIVAYTEALQVYTLKGNHANCAMVQGNLGVAYITRMVGNSVENQEQAIIYLKMSLQTYTITVSSQRFGESSTYDMVLRHAVSTGMGPY